MAVDIQQEMLDRLSANCKKRGVTNVVPVKGQAKSPNLKPGTVDLIILVDVYHEFSHPEPMLAAIKKSLKPDGQIVLVEFRKEDPKVPIKELHKMSKAQVEKEMVANGFKFVREFEGLPWQHMMFYGKAEAELEKMPANEDKTSNSK